MSFKFSSPKAHTKAAELVGWGILSYIFGGTRCLYLTYDSSKKRVLNKVAIFKSLYCQKCQILIFLTKKYA